MHMTRQQAAFDLQTSVGEHGYITELDIDRFLIASHEPEEGEEERTEIRRQKHVALQKRVRESYVKHFSKDDSTFAPPPPRLRPMPTPQRHESDFFYRSLQAPQNIRPKILAKLCSGTPPVFKSELRTQRPTTLSERIGKRQHAMQAAIRK